MAADRIDKTERLLNLTLALLATKRPMSKNEIFAQIPGYSGAPESMERMFERDKDELRDLGVEVKVLPTDLYFEDELGYQIIPRDFFLPELTLTSEESLWLALATHIVADFAPREEAKSGLQKLLTFSEGSLQDILQASDTSRYQIDVNDSIERIWRSIRNKFTLAFKYSSPERLTHRLASSIALTSRLGNWYLIAIDHEDHQVKTFRVDRMRDLTLNEAGQYLETPSTFNLDEFLRGFRGDLYPRISLRIHNTLSREHPLVVRSSKESSGETISPGEILEIENIDRNQALEMILWSAESVEVIAPKELREEIIHILEKIIEVNS